MILRRRVERQALNSNKTEIQTKDGLFRCNLCLLIYVKLAILYRQSYSLSPSASIIPLKTLPSVDRRLNGVSNSTHLPASKTKIRSESMIVCKRCAIVTTVQPANVFRIVCWTNWSVLNMGNEKQILNVLNALKES